MLLALLWEHRLMILPFVVDTYQLINLEHYSFQTREHVSPSHLI